MKRINPISTRTSDGGTMTIERRGGGFTITSERGNSVKETAAERQDRMSRQRGQGSGAHKDKRDVSRRDVKRDLRNGNW